jgi:UDP:flavonoid glycosyltransferase YjiC (YdhE family)
MRVLFSFAGGTGHAEPMVPVAQALRQAGHEVAFAGNAAYLPYLADRGFATFPVGGKAGGGPPAPRQRRPLLEPDQDREDRAVREHFADRLPRARTARYLALHRDWRPDLAVRDEMDFGAAVAAEVSDLPHAVVLVLAAGQFARPDLVAEPLDAIRAEHGLPPDPDLSTLGRGLVLSPFPPSFRTTDNPLPATGYPFRLWPTEPAPGERLPQWWQPAPDRPVVYVTLGTEFALEAGDVFDRLLAGLGQLPAEVVATVGREREPAELGAQPRHVHVEQWLPQSLLLPHTDLVVSHGGSGTLTAALAHGLPQLLLPLGADQLHNAARLRQLGIGRTLPAVGATPAQIRDAAAAVLTDPDTRAAADRQRRQYAALPDAASTVPLLERLT